MPTGVSCSPKQPEVPDSWFETDVCLVGLSRLGTAPYLGPLDRWALAVVAVAAQAKGDYWTNVRPAYAFGG